MTGNIQNDTTDHKGLVPPSNLDDKAAYIAARRSDNDLPCIVDWIQDIEYDRQEWAKLGFGRFCPTKAAVLFLLLVGYHAGITIQMPLSHQFWDHRKRKGSIRIRGKSFGRFVRYLIKNEFADGHHTKPARLARDNGFRCSSLMATPKLARLLYELPNAFIVSLKNTVDRTYHRNEKQKKRQGAYPVSTVTMHATSIALHVAAFRKGAYRGVAKNGLETPIRMNWFKIVTSADPKTGTPGWYQGRIYTRLTNLKRIVRDRLIAVRNDIRINLLEIDEEGSHLAALAARKGQRFNRQSVYQPVTLTIAHSSSQQSVQRSENSSPVPPSSIDTSEPSTHQIPNPSTHQRSESGFPDSGSILLCSNHVGALRGFRGDSAQRVVVSGMAMKVIVMALANAHPWQSPEKIIRSILDKSDLWPELPDEMDWRDAYRQIVEGILLDVKTRNAWLIREGEDESAYFAGSAVETRIENLKQAITLSHGGLYVRLNDATFTSKANLVPVLIAAQQAVLELYKARGLKGVHEASGAALITRANEIAAENVAAASEHATPDHFQTSSEKGDQGNIEGAAI